MPCHVQLQPARQSPWLRGLALAGAVNLAAVAPVRAQSPGSPARAPVPGAPAGVTAFVDVAVVPMDSARLLRHQTVLVQQGWITALGPAKHVRVPAGATRIDGRGKYLIPGLADMHTHLGPWSASPPQQEQVLLLYAANGVTTVRNVDYSPEVRRDSLGRGPLAYLAARAAAGTLWSPRIYTSTGYSDFASALAKATQPRTVADFVQVLTAYKAAGYSHVKLYDNVDLDSLTAAAHQIGLPVMGHAPGEGGPTRAIALGYASIEHLTGIVPSLYIGPDTGQRRSDNSLVWWWYMEDTTLAVRREVSTDPAKLHALGTLLRRAGVWNCPTLWMYEGLYTSDDRPEWRIVLADSSRQKYEQIARESRNVAPAIAAARRATVEVRGAIVKGLQEAGAGLLLGADAAISPLLMPGFSVHHELEMFVRAGLTPYAALATGTRNVAEYFGTLDSTGTVAVGKRADLVLLSGNPLADIRHTARPAGVMLGGRWRARAELNARLAALRGKLW